MTTLTVTEARRTLSGLIDGVAFKGERVMLRRNGKNIAAIISAEDVELLEALEDRIDLEEAKRRLLDGQEALPYDQVRAELGLP